MRKRKNGVHEIFKQLWSSYRARREQVRQRRWLLEMDERMLKDIGLSRADVYRMAGQKWFWQEPLNRLEDLDLQRRK